MAYLCSTAQWCEKNLPARKGSSGSGPSSLLIDASRSLAFEHVKSAEPMASSSSTQPRLHMSMLVSNGTPSSSFTHTRAHKRASIQYAWRSQGEEEEEELLRTSGARYGRLCTSKWSW